MKTLNLYLISIFAVLFTSVYSQVQHTTNQTIVKQLYEVLENKNTTSKEIAAFTSNIDWNKIKSEKGTKYNIRLNAIIKNEWQSILFKNLNFQLPDNNKVLVTGIVKGRKASECEYIFTRFKHSWSLKDGEIISFSE